MIEVMRLCSHAYQLQQLVDGAYRHDRPGIVTAIHEAGHAIASMLIGEPFTTMSMTYQNGKCMRGALNGRAIGSIDHELRILAAGMGAERALCTTAHADLVAASVWDLDAARALLGGRDPMTDRKFFTYVDVAYNDARRLKHQHHAIAWELWDRVSPELSEAEALRIFAWASALT